MIEIQDSEIKEIMEIALDREINEFSMAANFYEAYDMDSLGAVALVVEIQKRYDVRIPDERMPDVCTGDQLKAIVKELLKVKD
ncbi:MULTISPECIES: acyl carrier protein [unclassified Herbaspirillum]|uniref:acyl carrier protein n=1 Tax=unclassified Herbaspirillum TaxID=2624150 RepID=UPI00115129B6|nr:MULTISPECIES: acyl carrier protein [unclassified Herbaspirillum]MBB5393823.1 acyl carrier protein [Herbaspirillum sp. SJZ102]TQK01320.1 acyl carrier protein [Herbaspirillum sp. SJZ130]TQK05716.1 acyl carrier protein [Herbaspirillum sp. SJZ106]